MNVATEHNKTGMPPFLFFDALQPLPNAVQLHMGLSDTNIRLTRVSWPYLLLITAEHFRIAAR
jgi:hypothetical protein